MCDGYKSLTPGVMSSEPRSYKAVTLDQRLAGGGVSGLSHRVETRSRPVVGLQESSHPPTMRATFGITVVLHWSLISLKNALEESRHQSQQSPPQSITAFPVNEKLNATLNA